MWRPIKLIMDNMFSHEYTEINFKIGENLIIYGVNEDDLDGAESNGSGKSSIVESVIIALTGESDRRINQDKFIRRGCKNASVSLLLQNNFLNKELLISRSFQLNASAKIEIWENGLLNKEVTKKSESDNRIYELLGVKKQDLFDYFIIGQENKLSFFRISDTDKKATISRFSDFSRLDTVLDKINLELKETNKTIQNKEIEIKTFKTQISDLTYALDNMLEEDQNKKNTIQEEIRELNNDIKEIENEKQVLSENIFNLKKQKVEIENQVSNFENFELTITELERDTEQLKTKMFDFRKILQDVELALSSKITCPSCNHEFCKTHSNITPAELLKQKIEIEKSLVECKTDMKFTEKRREEFEIRYKKFKTNERKVEQISREIKNYTQDIKNCENRENKIKDQISKLLQKLEDLNNKKDSLNIQNIKNKIKNKTDDLAKTKNEILELVEQKADLDFWYINFGRSGFYSYLANKTLDIIEGNVNYYLKKFGTDLSIVIKGYTKLKSGDLRDKIECLVVKNEIEEESYHCFSGGEKARIDICTILTFQKLVNTNSPTGGLDLLILDEKFEGLDLKGQQRVVKMLENSGVTNLLISHNNNEVGALNKIVVTKKNKISYIA